MTEGEAMSRIAVLQHVWCENAGAFGEALTKLGHQLDLIKLWDGDPLPAADAYDAWLIMGGPMSVDDKDDHPYLPAECELLAGLIAEDRPMMGVCLGSQLLAKAAGGRVFAKRPKEIGLFDIELTASAAADPLFALMSNPQEVFQWHGDTFDLPSGAVQLARSPRYEQQAFRIGRRVYGLQFHLEFTPRIVRDVVNASQNELAELPEEDEFEQYIPRLATALNTQQELAERVIHRWAELI
jgi:GMP synthase-like glutamine amidotransferase